MGGYLHMNLILPSEVFRTSVVVISLAIVCMISTACGDGNRFTLNSAGAQSGYQVPSQYYESDPSVEGFDLSGTLTVSGNAVCDWDVNDPEAPYQANDTPEEAQSIQTPAVVGGFVRGDVDNKNNASEDSQDLEDYYSVALSAGDTITMLEVDQAQSGAITVELRFASTPNRVFRSFLLDAGKSISVTQENDYLIHVYAIGGSFNYLLEIGGQDNGNETAGHSSEAFVTGEAIVRFKETTAAVQSKGTVTSWLLQNSSSAEAVADRPVLMRFNTTEKKQSLMRQLNLTGEGIETQTTPQTAADSEQDETLAIIDALNQRPDVAYAEPNYYRRLQYVPNDEYYFYQWHYPMINLEAAWDITLGSEDVVVAVIDSGILADHPDLEGKITDSGYDFISDSSMSLDYNGLDDDPTDPGDQMQGGSSFHGTHVAGTIAAATDNRIGVAGVGGMTRIMPLRSFGLNGLGTVADTLQALRYAAGMSNDSGRILTQPADIINLSLGGASYSQAEAELFEEIINNRNIIVVAAAGNESTSQSTYPAAYPGVISVSAVDSNGDLAPYSNYGNDIDLAAPGGNLNLNVNQDNWPDGVLSSFAVEDNGLVYDYGFYEGTSMAAPHVSGVMALMKAVKPDLLPVEVQGWLTQGLLSMDLGAADWDRQFGYGLIDAFRAVSVASSGEASSTGLSFSPREINLGSSQSQATFRLNKIGNDLLSFQEIISNKEWITVDSQIVDDEGVGSYRLEVDRTHPQLSEQGTHTAQITFVFWQESLSLNVNVEVAGDNALYDEVNYIGHLHVLLIDPDRSTRYGISAQYQGDGKYTFEFINVPPGNYRLVAGSNRDFDGYIGEPGEALSLEEQPIDLNRDILLNDDIPVDYNLP